MPAIKLRIAKEDRAFYGEGTLSAAVKAKLVEALADVDAMPVPEGPASHALVDTLTLWLSDAQQAAVDHLMRVHRIQDAGLAASGLLHAWARATAPAAAPAPTTPAPAGALTTLDTINQALGDPTRVDQARFFAGLAEEVLERRPSRQVVFAEASTGVGKTRAFLALALQWCADHPGERAMIAAPSYNVLLQIIGQWDRIAAVHATPLAQVIVGQQEFVSRHALERVLHETPDAAGAAQARAWMDRGGPPAEDDPFGHPWLMRSLVMATHHAWSLRAEVVLDSDVAEDDPGSIAYRAQFTDAGAAAVVFCTHAMLAVEVRRRTVQAIQQFSAASEGVSVADAAWAAWSKLSEADRKTSRSWQVRNDLLRDLVAADIGRLPAIGLLIVDEAHLIEQAFAAVFASGASMARLRLDLKRLHEAAPRAVSGADIASMDAIWSEVRAIGAAVDADRMTTTSHPALGEAIERMRVFLAAILKRLPAKVVPRPEARQLRSVAMALEVAARAAGERSGMSTRVSWSPSVQWPSIDVGRYDVSRELDFLWSLVVQDRTVLVSATLFEDVSREGLESMRRTLSVRSAQVRPLVPVRPAWLFDPVTLHLVGDTVDADGWRRFRRPTQRDRLDPPVLAERTDRWRADVSDYLAATWASAAGGVLVLLTSHAERAEVVSRMDGRIPADCLLTQADGLSLDALREAFLRVVAAGQRPCLIGVGAAWTGLDLSGDGLAALTGRPVPAPEDNVLTDLVIPTAPVGINRSLTHEWRRERQGMVAEIGATSITFRQGVGRLIRRAGVPANRRLHVLDARIHESAWNPLMAPVLRTLARYTRRQTV